MPIFVRIDNGFRMSFSFKGKRWLPVVGLVLLLGCVHRGPNPPVPPSPDEEDPIVQVKEPGAYGIPGGSQVYNPERHQLSVLESTDGTQAFRLLDAGERKVLSVSGIPANLTENSRISLSYRILVNGYTLQKEQYQDVLVLKVTDKLIWLKKDETVYFVLQR